jgi:uncharacterized damage-inducible protein DinB
VVAVRRVVMNTNSTRPEPDREKVALLATLDAQRGHILAMVDGLDDEALRKAVLPSGWHCLGLINHLSVSEDYWFRRCANGEPAQPTAELNDDTDDWFVPEDEPAAAVLDRYREVAARSNEIISATPLDEAPKQPDPQWDVWGKNVPDLRTILLHVIVDTAVHAGQLDATRELIDGRQWIVL